MQLSIFAKKRTSKDGREFYNYFTKLTRKDGEEITTTVKFREEAGAPSGKECPCNILVDKSDCNFVEKGIVYKDENGNDKDAIERVLWVSKWEDGEPYVDKSLDDFEGFN